MRSLLMDNVVADSQNYTDLRVCQSAAGFYIGTMYADPELDGMFVPGSRDSVDYYPTKEAAQVTLDTRSWVQRDHP